MKTLARIVVAATMWVWAMGTGAAEGPVANPGFEDPPSGGPMPAWHPATGDAALAIDDAVAHSGQRSLRLDFRAPFSGVAQVVDAKPYRGRKVVLRAMLRSRDLGRGHSGLWLRADTVAGEPIAFEHSYLQALDGTHDWVAREVTLVVPESANGLMFGATIGATGSLWVDDVALLASPMPARPPEAAARGYLEDALDLIEGRAYHADRIDWPATRAASLALATDATQPVDTYPAIRAVLAALRDNHSHLVSPERMVQVRSEDAPGDYGVEGSLSGKLGYVRVPGFAGVGRAPSAAFSAQLRASLRSQADSGACGWIVDLRGNRGGNMYPMLAGLRDLLGDGVLGYFVDRKGRKPWRAPGEGEPLLTHAPVAVLIDGRTASSGEAVLVSFIGRAHTRSFGADTFGVSTANVALPLADGASLALTVALQADRNGKTYGGAIAPDEDADASQPESARADDPAILAASAWLGRHSACTGAAPNARLE